MVYDPYVSIALLLLFNRGSNNIFVGFLSFLVGGLLVGGLPVGYLYLKIGY